MRTVIIDRVPAGKLFYAFGYGALAPGLFLKVVIKTNDNIEPFLQAHLMLVGATPFQLFKLKEEEEDTAVLSIPAPGLSAKFDTNALSAISRSGAGSLLVGGHGPCLLVSGPGNREMLVRLEDGLCIDTRPRELCFVSDWQLISVNASGAESLLLEVVPGSEPPSGLDTSYIGT